MLSRSVKKGMMIAALLSTNLTTASCDAQDTVINLDPSVKHQIFSGWESNVELLFEPGETTYDRIREEVYDRSVNEVGINRVRLEVRSGAENPDSGWTDFLNQIIGSDVWYPRRYPAVNDNDDPFTINPTGFDFSELDFRVEAGVLPVRQRVSANGEKLFVNLCYVAFTGDIEGGHIHQNPEEYAEFMLASYQHMEQKYGFVPDAIEVILEPDLSPHWDGKWIGRAIVAAGRRLEQAGYTPRFIAPSTTDMRNAISYFDDLADVDGATGYMYEISYHRYKGNSDSKNVLKKLVARAQKYDLGTSMLEWWFGHANHDVLHEDLKLGHNTAWQGRELRDLFTVHNPNSDKPTLTLPNDTRMNIQYTKYIRPGAQRIGATSTNERQFDPLAFINTNGSYVVVVKANRAGTFTINGLPAGQYTISYATGETSDTEEHPLSVNANGRLDASIPAAGVITASGMAVDEK